MSFWSALLRLLGNRPKPTSQRWTLTIHVSPADADVRLTFDGKTWPAGPGGMPTRVMQFSTPSATPNVSGVLSVVRQGYVSQSIDVPTIGPPNQTITVQLQPAVQAPIAIHAEGTELHDANGRAVFLLGLTAFPLLKAAVEDDPALVAFLDYCQQYGLMPRALGSYDNLAFGRFVPTDYGLDVVQQRLDWLAGQCSRRGLRLKLSVLADRNRSAALAAMDPQGYLDRCAEALRSWPNTILDTGNEYAENGWDPQAFTRPNHPLVSRGSNGAGIPPRNPWDVFDHHGRRDREWKIGLKDLYGYQSGSDGVFIGATPAGDDEPISISENPNDDGKKCVTDPGDVYDWIATPFGSYVVLHVRAGMTLQVPGPVATACVEAALKAAEDLPAEWRAGTYIRGGPGGGAFALVDSPQTPDNGSLEESHPDWWHRAYGRARGDEQWITIVRHTAETNDRHAQLNADLAGRLAARDGWRIVETRGFTPDRPSIVHLERT